MFGSHFGWIDVLGYIGAGFSIGAFSMKTLIPLRILGISSNVTFLIYSSLHQVYPSLLVHAVLLPLNVIRLRQMLRLIKKVRVAAQGDLSLDWLKPFMTRRAVQTGETLFAKDDPAEEMFYTVTGLFRLRELGLDLGPGQVVGELGLLAPDNRRTQTLDCVADGEVLTIKYQQVRELYFQNPEFGFFFLRLTTQRLFQNIARLQSDLEQARAAPHPVKPGFSAEI